MGEHMTRAARTAPDDSTIGRPQPPSRPPAPVARRGAASLVAVLLVGAGIGYLLGYEEYSSRSAKVIAPAACSLPAASARSTRLTGTVRSADGATLVVQEGTRTGVSVALGAATVCRAVGARVDEVRPGQRVTVVGTRGADGTIVAAQVVVTNETRTSPG